MRRTEQKRRTMTWAFLALLLPGGSAFADESADRTLSPYFLVEGSGAIEQFPLEEARIDFTVTGVIANVKVTQTYRNRGGGPIHAQYVFPASTRAAVHGMSFRLDDRVIRANIKEREEAQRAFAKAKSEGKGASLLEQDRPNVFRMSVANILPGEQVQVELEYSELLVPNEGIYEFVYPTVVGPRYSSEPAMGSPVEDAFIRTPFSHAGTPPAYRFALQGTINTGVAIHELKSPSHRIHVAWQAPSQAGLALEDTEQSGGQRDFILRYRLEGDQVQSGLILQEGGDENLFLLMVQPPKRVPPQMVPAREYVFVVDVSGSMFGFPLSITKELMRGLASKLRPQDRFNVLLFSGGSQLMSPTSVPATSENVAAALALIDSQRGGGGTELAAALQRALELPAAAWMSRTFVVVTDGYVGGERAAFAQVHEHLGAANVFCFGIGTSVNRYLVEGIARAGLGESFVVTKPEAAAAEARRFAAYVESPVLTRLHLEAEGVEISDVEPRTLPDVLSDRPVVVYGKWRGPRSGRLRLFGQSGLGPYAASFDLAQSRPTSASAGLEYLWARTRIGNLSDFGDGRDEQQVKSEVTQLGLRYHLLTRFTSFIAVSEQRRTGAAGTDVSQPLPMPEGVSDAAVGEVAVGAEPGWIVCLALAMGALVLARLRLRRA